MEIFSLSTCCLHHLLSSFTDDYLVDDNDDQSNVDDNMTALCVCSDSRRQHCHRGRQTQDEEIMLCVHIRAAQRINIFKSPERR